MKIVVGGQIEKEKLKNLIEKYIPNAEVSVKSDINAAMDVKNKVADYYFGSCVTGGGGSLAMAIALLGADKTVTIASPLTTLSEEEIKKEIENGKIAFGFTGQTAEYSIKAIAKYINK